MYINYKTLESKIVKFAIVGCGRISANHSAAINEHAAKAKLVAICDIDSNKLDKTINGVNNNDLKLYTNLNDMLKAGGFDIVVLCTPSGLHASQAELVASYGYHVLTEKPMATKFDDAVSMVKKCDYYGVRLFVVKQNRQNETIKALKNAITTGRFGRIYNVACNVFWTRPQEYYDAAPWRGTWEFDGGAFMNQASHYVDLLEWLVGNIESVQSYTSTLARDIEAEDSGVVAIKWRNGALGTMNVSMLTYPKNYEGSITIIGELGTAKISGIALNKIEHWEFATMLDSDHDIMQSNYDTKSVYGYGHSLYYNNVINTLLGTEEANVDGRSGLKSIELLTAIYTSARDGSKVSLPLRY